MTEPLVFEKHISGYPGPNLPKLDVDLVEIPEEHKRKSSLRLPSLPEQEVFRHYTRLSRMNYSQVTNFYPLGSCTMKYNPVVNEEIARLAGFSDIHPYQPEDTVQGALELMYKLKTMLCKIVGMDDFCLQPAAGAHGEWTGLKIVKAFFESKNEQRNKVLVPDSAHGTNPASAATCGFHVVEVKSTKEGTVSIDDLKQKLDSHVAALMLTNPNTLGIFEKDILEIANMVHEVGALLYYDGANLNALMGICRPGDMGFDVVHLNLHKTFSTPHGGGGPGAGPVGVKEFLAKFLPVPRVELKDGKYVLNEDVPESIGYIRSFYGNFGVLVRAYAYIIAMGGDGLRQASLDAVLAANYLMHKISAYFVPTTDVCKHEFVVSASSLMEYGVRAVDVAKALLDYGFYAPTVYFPLVVPEALMIEPTETESLDTLDRFANAMLEIAQKAKIDPDTLHSAPRTTPVGRLDEVEAARHPILRWKPE